MSTWLLLIWVILMRDVTPLTILGGLLVIFLIQLCLPLPHIGAWRRLRPGYALILGLGFLWDLVVASCQVASLVLRRRKPKPIAICVQLYSSAELYLTMVTAMTCLIPGSIVVRAQLAPSRLVLHVLDEQISGGAQQVAADIHQLEMRILRALATPDQLEQAAASRKRHLENLHLVKADASSWSAKSNISEGEDGAATSQPPTEVRENTTLKKGGRHNETLSAACPDSKRRWR